ncbi:Putative uncharacterized transposon-derived protein F52C9.6 [Eumeta japonica]|uniref:Uncharacterized transposon-derived protein F52C9.6 n=1 Tax=Eumeta variegata TaxID=151549 RepID=A0A4C1ZEB8_EUMVA|nr:Putative uncharacterized transposon-derived protein F52C9.6 [Eumeta japonica]
MQKQTIELKESITNSVIEKMEEKLKPVIEENKNLKAYSPTEPLRKEDITKVERFYEDLQLTTANAHKNIIVMGDFNGQIGKQKNGEDYTIGIHGVGNRSGNGSRGDPISPKIFSAVLEMIFRNLNWTKNGLNINGENLNHLRFADDLILFSEDARTLEIMLQQLSDESVKTWALTELQENKLKVCQNSMERSILGIKRSDGVKLEIIKKKTKFKNVHTAYRQIKWRWTGHMSRENIEKWSRLVTEWYPRDGKRSRGRPNKRWEDDLRKIAGPVWSRLARDRDKWKSLEEAFVDRQAVQQKQPVAD